MKLPRGGGLSWVELSVLKRVVRTRDHKTEPGKGKLSAKRKRG